MCLPLTGGRNGVEIHLAKLERVHHVSNGLEAEVMTALKGIEPRTHSMRISDVPIAIRQLSTDRDHPGVWRSKVPTRKRPPFGDLLMSASPRKAAIIVLIELGSDHFDHSLYLQFKTMVSSFADNQMYKITITKA